MFCVTNSFCRFFYNQLNNLQSKGRLIVVMKIFETNKPDAKVKMPSESMGFLLFTSNLVLQLTVVMGIAIQVFQLTLSMANLKLD